MSKLTFPIKTKTRAGYDATVTGYSKYYEKPLVGIVQIEGMNFPLGWDERGNYTSPQIEHAYDITLPE